MTNVFFDALALLLQYDDALLNTVWTSLRISITAIMIATPCACAIAALLLVTHGTVLGAVLRHVCQLLCAIPAIAVGLVVYLLFMREGIFGDLQWLFTTNVIIVGQVLLAIPLIAIGIYNAAYMQWRTVFDTAVTLGKRSFAAFFISFSAFRGAIVGAVLVAFGRIIAEIGSALIVGGGIMYHTQTVSTAIALEVRRGDFARAVALGIVLLICVLSIQVLVSLRTRMQSIYN